MTVPEQGLSLGDPRVVLGERLFRSWLLVFGVLPVDYDDVVLESIDSGRSFNERSSMLTQREWHHDRELEPCTAGTQITDRLAWAPRLPGAGLIFRVVVPRLFRWRHRQLRRRFGGRPVSA
jgi:ligand-binding SRPBCC domain-containing protein